MFHYVDWDSKHRHCLLVCCLWAAWGGPATSEICDPSEFLSTMGQWVRISSTTTYTPEILVSSMWKVASFPGHSQILSRSHGEPRQLQIWSHSHGEPRPIPDFISQPWRNMATPRFDLTAMENPGHSQILSRSHGETWLWDQIWEWLGNELCMRNKWLR